MGNRAVITTEDRRIGVYLHWNGGRDSVRAFLTYCKMKQYRCPEEDCYGWARLCQVVGNYFGGECSVGVDSYLRLDRDNRDNGVYVIKGWNIVKRMHHPKSRGEQDSLSLNDMLLAIDASMPVKEQLGKDAVLKWLEDHSEEAVV